MSLKVSRKEWFKEPLAMPIGDIVQDYCAGKNPKEMLGILADMNETNTIRIAWILDRCGVPVNQLYMPRPPRDPGAEDPREYWAASRDAVECDRIRKQREELRAERQAAQKMQPVGETAETVGATAETVGETVESVGGFLKTVSESDAPVRKPEEPVIATERYHKGIGAMLADFWNLYLENRKDGPLTESDVRRMLELEHMVLDMEKDYT